MDPVLIAGIILIALLVGVPLLQSVIKRRQAAVEGRLPHVDALAALALRPDEYPAGYAVQYRGPVTNERLAYGADDEDEAFAAIDSAGRLIGYRQTFRQPRSYGELADVLLNLSLRRDATHRQIDVEVVLFEDEEGAIEGIQEELPPNPHIDPDGNSLEVASYDEHDLGFASSVRAWSRIAPGGQPLQRKLDARWHEGRLGCFVTGDAEPAASLDPSEVLRIARAVHERAARSDLRAAPVASP